MDKPRHVVCAALRNRYTGRIICGPRHFDPIMRAQIETDAFWVWSKAEQGFVDQKGAFLTREEAEEVARTNGQLKTKLFPGPLFSEELY